MGSMNVYDDGSQSWGSIGSGFASAIMAAPAKAAAQQHMIETIKDQRIKRDRDQQLWDAALGAANNVDAATPAAVAPPSTMTVPGPYVGDPASDPGVTRDLPTADVTYTDPRAQALADSQRKLAVTGQRAAILADPKQWAQQTAYGTVAAAGVPDSAKERARLDFLAGKGMPTHLGVDESKSPVKNWNELDPTTNQPTGRQVSSTKQPGPNFVLGSARSLTPDNTIESVPIAQNNFNRLADKIMRDAAAGKTPDEADLLNAIKLRDAGWQSEIKLERDANTQKLVPVTVPKTPPPTEGAAGYLFQVLKDRETRLRGPDAAGAGAAAAGAGAAAPAAVAPAPAADASGITVGTPIMPGTAQHVVKRYMDQPVIDYMEKSKSGYSSVVSAMPQDNKAADIAIVNGASKVIDPPGVVRPTEAAAVEKTQGALDQLAGMMSSIAGGARLTKTGRYQIWNMINEKMKSDMENARAIREQHMVQLREAGFTPEQAAQYLPALPTIAEVNPDIINSIKTPDFGDTSTTTPSPTTTAPPPRPRF